MTDTNLLLQPEITEKIPGFANKPWFKKLLHEMINNFQSENPQSWNQISTKLTISHQRLYEVLNHEYTKKKIQEIVNQQGIKDLSEIYLNVKKNSKNPQHAALWLKYFSPVQPKDQVAGGNIILNLNLFRADVISDKVNKDVEIEEAEYTPVVQADDKQ